ncbi:MAG: outer membrane beta-barrel protein [Brevundimonas sp.]
MRILIVAAVAAAAASALALPAAAQTMTSPELSVSAGYARFVDGSEDWDGHSFTARGTARFNRFFGVEADLAVGLGSSEIAGVDIKMNNNIAGYAVAYLPLSEQADLFARVGYGSTEFELEFGGASVTESYDGYALGVGGQYFFDANNGVRMDVTRHEYDDLDGGLDSVAFTYVRRF